MIGRTLSHYEIIDRLGAGGMGEVFLAVDSFLDRRVALKFLPEETQKDSPAHERFLKEARSIAALDHPFICKLFEVGEIEGRAFLAMEYLDGETLGEVLKKGPLPLMTALKAAIEILEALETAHSKGIAHLDLKPANLMITRDGHLKVLDFGIARHIRREDEEETLEPGGHRLSGTLMYMSPEQVVGKRVDSRSDIFSAGVVLYEMLTGRHPFQQANAMATAVAIVNDSPEPISTIDPSIPPAVVDLVESMLAKKPDDRCQSAREARERLEDEILPTGASRPRVAARVAEEQPQPSIAVLPFRNVSPDPENKYFSDGLTEELINALMGLEGLRVVSRTTVFSFQDDSRSLESIADQLRVRHVLEGSVRKSGNQVRISARLIDVTDGCQVWADNFDRGLDDIFAVQDDIARTIVARLEVPLHGTERALVKRHTENLRAYQLYLKGRFYWGTRNPQDLPKALEHFEAALQEDQNYALAYSGLADYHTVYAFYGISPSAEAFAKAKSAALRALELDDSLADPHVSLGICRLFFEWDWEAAATEFRLALRLNRNFVEAYIGRICYSLVMNQLEAGLEEARRALSIDPLNIPVLTYEAMIHLYMGNYEKAIELGTATLPLAPDSVELHYVLGLAYQENGDLEQAIATFERNREIAGQHPLVLAFLGACYAKAGRTEDAGQLLSDLTQRREKAYIQPFALAVLHAGLGDGEQALKWLDRAADARDPIVVYLQVIPTFDDVRGDNRYLALLEKMGLE